MKKLLFILLIITASGLKAQDPFFFRIDKSAGLPSNTVYDIFQDSKGFIWIANGQGLCRYDGRKFVQFSSDTQTMKSGSNIREDKYGRIWYENFDGYIYYLEKDSLHKLQLDAIQGFLRFSITDNYLFCIEPGAVLMFDLSNLKLKRRYEMNTTEVIESFGDNDAFYVLTDKILRFNSSNYATITNKLSSFGKIQAPLFTANNKKFIIASKYSEKLFLIENKTLKNIQIPYKDILTQNISIAGNYNWLCTTTGVIQFKDNSQFEHFFKNKNITSVFKDKDGAYWVGTLKEGILYIPDFNVKFIPVTEEVNVIDKVNNKMIFGTGNDALYTYNYKNTGYNPLFNGKSGHEVYMLKSDSADKIHMITSNSFRVLTDKGFVLGEYKMAVKDVAKIRDKEYAFAATGMLGFININGGKIAIKPLLTGIRGKSVTYDSISNTVYFATNIGLFKYQNGKLNQIKNTKNQTLFFHQIRYLKNKLYGITSAGKLIFIDKNGYLIQFKRDIPDLNNSFRRIKVCNDNIYIFAGNSIYKKDIVDGEMELIYSLDNKTDLNDLIATNTGLTLATSSGIIVIPQHQHNKPEKPILAINALYVNAQKTDGISNKTFSNQKNNIGIEYSLISFHPESKTKLYYRINDAKWQIINDDRNILELNNLRFGNYNIQLKAVNANISSSTINYQFKISAPFWLQWWFISILLVALFLILRQFDKWRTNQINKKSTEIIERMKLEKSANQSKLKAIKSQMNPHFFFNALNTIQSFILENDKKHAVSYLSKFSGLTRSILEMSERDEVSVAEEIRVLKLYLDIEQVRFNGDFQYTIVTTNFDSDDLKIPSLLLQPYVENAVKHGLLHKHGHKQLDIEFILQNEELKIMIIDNGIGRIKSFELNAIKNRNHKSFATNATEERMQLLNEFSGSKISLEYIDNYFDNGLSSGTTVIIHIPLKKVISQQ